MIGMAYRLQADAALIEARAKVRLADEYDAAKAGDEVAKGRPKTLPDGNTLPTAADLGLKSKEIHEARQFRNAERAEPGLAERALNAMVERGEEPTRAAMAMVKGRGKEKGGRCERPPFPKQHRTGEVRCFYIPPEGPKRQQVLPR